MGETNILTILGLLLMGAIGAMVKDILEDGSLKLPSIVRGKLFLGFVGSVLIGAIVGYLVDHSPLMAFFAGYTGFSTLSNLMPTTLGESKKG